MPSFQKAPSLTIHTQNCSKVSSPLSQCEICVQACPEKTLLFHNEQWQAAQCLSCGLCAALCPNQVFQLDAPALRNLVQAKQILQLTCTRSKQVPAEALQINCLQQLSPLLLFELLSYGADLTIYYCPEACADCEMQWYPQGLEIQLKQYHLPLERLHLAAMEPAKASNMQTQDRRSFLKELTSTTRHTSTQLLMHSLDRFLSPFEALEEEKQALLPDVPSSRMPLVKLYQEKPFLVDTAKTLPFRRLQCDDCNFCGACARLCPTKALQMEFTTKEQSLVYDPKRCNQCNLCQDICFKHQLSWQAHLTIAEFLSPDLQILAHSEEKTCAHCGHSYYQYPDGGHALCSFCDQ